MSDRSNFNGKNNPAYKHGLCGKHPLYNVWQNMKRRCDSPSLRQYKDYGGRGIFVCREWLHDFGAFFKWAISAGWGPGLTIDRRNNNGGYSPTNCRFVTRVIQGRNQRHRSTSAYPRGVDLNAGAFRVRVTVDKKTIFIGRFESVTEATHARKEFIQTRMLSDYRYK